MIHWVIHLLIDGSTDEFRFLSEHIHEVHATSTEDVLHSVLKELEMGGQNFSFACLLDVGSVAVELE